MKHCLSLVILTLGTTLSAGIKDTPFLQDRAVKFANAAELAGAVCQRLGIDKDGIVYVLTDKGLARLFGDTLALDQGFRPLAGKKPRDITVHDGNLYYLYDDQFLSNGEAGKHLGELPPGTFNKMALTENGTVALAGPVKLALFQNSRLDFLAASVSIPASRLFPRKEDVFFTTAQGIRRFSAASISLSRPATNDAAGSFFYPGEGITTLAFHEDQLLVGTHNGYFGIDLDTGRQSLPLQTNLPATDITTLVPDGDDLWVGTTRGVFRQTKSGRFDYYASRRWLLDDDVVDIQPSAGGGVFILTRTGLNKIEFVSMTLAKKAAYYENKIRQRHIRYGFCSELLLAKPGDITSAEMIDTDNDGSWSNYYMASQAFHYAATGDLKARANAWETFEALERLESIAGLNGFPARTFERTGFKFSDTDRWRPAADKHWEWKGHTSSDEVIAHIFGCSVLYETAAKTEAERQRITQFVDKIMSHIIRNNWYLIDVDGKPTLWGRWNPEYVNKYPSSVGDRRLNSAEIIAGLQFAYKITGKDIYKTKAFELMDKYGYLKNIRGSMSAVGPTRGQLYQGMDMGGEWNHSDDLLGFISYWVLHRCAFNKELRDQFDLSIRDHFEIEKVERCPLWSFIYASTGAKDFNPQGALWTLRQFPLDLVDWSVENSRRKDVHFLPPNFRQQQTSELLPPKERAIMRWNGNPFTLDGGNGGHTELAGDEFLLPYWMGRYLKIID